ncbi:MAG: integrase core domain-containing protein [Bacteroidetes bacterium]|nr:integrase core domain-containing protein [Bacteroidota bacterium]
MNGILKEEFLLNQVFTSFIEAETAVNKAVEKYNHIRPHDSCDKLTPVQAHSQNGFLRKRWKTKAENKLLTN